jgi:hypothetical protein
MLLDLNKKPPSDWRNGKENFPSSPDSKDVYNKSNNCNSNLLLIKKSYF